MKRTKNKYHQNKLYIGIDNGVSGTIAICFNNEIRLIQTPVFSEQNYTKAKKNITRVNIQELSNWILAILEEFDIEATFCLIERPMVNPGRFSASISAVRALETTLNVIEYYNIPYQYIDSREWQKALLPSGIKGAPELKKASMHIGCRLFPQFKEQITKHKDADGLLIAEYCRRYY